MNCSPNALMAAATCYRCLPRGMTREVWIALLCQLLQKRFPVPTPPATDFSFDPPTAIIAWHDSGGNKVGNLAYFNLHANIATVTTVTFGGGTGPFNVTNIYNLSSLPALTHFVANSNALVSLDATGCLNLTTLDVGVNPLASLILAGCTALTNLYCMSGQLTSLSLAGLPALVYLDCSYNALPSITGLATCTALATLSCGNNAITNLNLTGFSALTGLDCTSNSMTTLTVTGCAALSNIDCSSNSLGSITGLASCPQLDYLNVGSNHTFSTVDISGNPLLNYVVLSVNLLSVLSVNTILANLDSFGLSAGSLDLSQQTPAAPPSLGPPNGIAALANLTARSWTITTD